MKHTARFLVATGVALWVASAMSSQAADPQRSQLEAATAAQKVKSTLQVGVGQGAVEQAAQASAGQAAQSQAGSEPGRRNPGAAATNRDRGAKYFGENSVRKSWSWWQQDGNGSEDDPEDGGDDLPPENTPTPDSEDSDDDLDKVTICHIPPGNPANAHTISVSPSAVNAHLAHADTLGPCPGDESPPDP